MSNNTVFEYDATYPTVEPEILPEAPVEVETPSVEEEQPQPQKKNGAARLFAAIFAVIAIACAFLPCIVAKGTGLGKGAIYNAIFASIGGTDKIFGVIPTVADTATALGQLAGLSVYVMAVCLVLSVVCGIVAVFSTKNAPCRLRATVFFLTFGIGTFCVCNFLYAYHLTGNVMESLTSNLLPVVVAVVGFVAYLVLAFAKVGKKAGYNVLQTVLSLAAVSAVAFFVAENEAAMQTLFNGFGLGDMATMLTLIVHLVTVIGAALALLRLTARKKNAGDLIRFIVMLLVAAVAAYAAFTANVIQTMLIVAIVAAVAALLNVIVWFMSGAKKREKVKAKSKKEKKVQAAAPAEAAAPTEEYIREEYAEALPYEGGPVEGVEIAEEVNPTYVAPPPEVQTAGYDFYNCKSFDPFIAILNQEERNQFTELFILKYKGVMPELPDYVVGGDNKNFFRKLFIYLGQYRDRIPDGLLTKMYQYAVRM